ncbi:MAG TPA: sigma-70 family RNA polymerase sigma factor, partial [Humisphaera sp.]
MHTNAKGDPGDQKPATGSPPPDGGAAGGRPPGSDADRADARGKPLSPDVVIRLHGSRVLGYIRRIFPAALKQRYDPVDLFQTTLFEAFRRADAFQHVSDEATLGWLFVLARRQVGMAVRAERRLKRGGGQPGDDVVGLLAEYAVHRRTPSQSAMRHETLRIVESALADLPPHLGEAVKLRYLDGLSPAEVGEKIGRTERAAA